MAQSKLQLVKNASGKGVSLAVNKKGVQVGVLSHSPKPGNQVKVIPAQKLPVPAPKTQNSKAPNQTTPGKQKLVQTTLKSPTSISTTAPPKVKTPTTKVEKPVPKPPTKKPETQTTIDKAKAQDNIRENVRKTLLEQLSTRLKEVEDLKLTEEEVTKLAQEIETQLYKLFGDAGPKYRTKYRSLIFNIKDTKNQTLWRRICDKSIAPAQLVRLSPDDLASQELARWREQENKHQLEMIKKSELEMLSINRTYVLKTHKGEQVMEDKVKKVDSEDIIPGLSADSTSEETAQPSEKSESSDHSSDRHSKTTKHSRRDKDRKTSKDRRSHSKERRKDSHHSSRDKRKRSRSRDRSSRDRSSHRDRKRSRSRDRHHRSSHKSSRHKRDKHSIDYLDKKSKEILDNLENNKIVPPEDRLWKHVPQQDIQVATPVDSDSDHEPTSTVTIPTPPRSIEQEETHTEVKIEPKTEVKVQKTDPLIKTEPEPPKSFSPPPKEEEIKEEREVTTPTLESKVTSLSKETIVWEGNINMIDVAKFFITMHEVSGDCSGIGVELPTTLEIVGRISPDTVWEYISKMKRSNSKMICILRLTAANMEEKMPYIALYSYLSSRNRLGVIKSTTNAVKDFYILPLASHSPVPQTLLPLSGPGFEESRPHLLLGIIVRAKRKRLSTTEIVSAPVVVKKAKIDSPTIVDSVPPRSYTPPPSRDPRVKLPTIPAVVEPPVTNDEDEPYSPEDSDPESSLPPPSKPDLTSNTSNSGTLNAADLTSMLSTTLKSATFLDGNPPSFEPFSGKFEGIPGLEGAAGGPSSTLDSQTLKKKMEELDKCIEKQKEEIRSISQDLVQTTGGMATNLSGISLPSNLQQILDSIKNIPSTGNPEQDALNAEEYTPSTPGYKSASSEELTIPLLLPKLSSRSQPSTRTEKPSTPTIPLNLPQKPSESILPNLTLPPPNLTPTIPTANNASPIILPNTNVPPPLSSVTIPLNLPKIKPKTTPVSTISPPGTSPIVIPTPDNKMEGKDSILSKLSADELLRRANEMLGITETPKETEEKSEEVSSDYVVPKAFKSAPIMYSNVPPKRPKIDISQPPIPGLEEEEPEY